MSVSFYPYVSFPGNGIEAMTYYQEIFGGELDVITYEAFPAEVLESFPFAPPVGALAHAQLKGGMIELTGGDGMGEDLPSLTNDVYSFLISADTTDEAKQVIDKLVATGGSVAMPFELAPWGSYYGQVKDKFGVLWSFDVAV